MPIQTRIPTPRQTADDTDCEATAVHPANAPSASGGNAGAGLMSGGSRRVRLLVAAGLSVLLALTTVWAFGAFGGPSHHPASSNPGDVTAPGGVPSGGGGVSPGSAPRSGTDPAPGARAGTSTAQGVVPTPSNGWKTRDSAVLGSTAAMYFIAGTAYGDPSGNQDSTGLVTMSSAKLAHLKRGGRSAGALDQLVQAIQAVGGKADVSRGKSGGGKALFTLPAGRSIVMNLHGWVHINGRDAFGLRYTSSGWTSTATGPNVRAFLAGFIEGEGSAKGLVGDDPTYSHLSFIRALMATPQAYGVRTVMQGTRYFRLYVASPADFSKVQAYPFLTYVRVPGGQP